MSIVEAFVPNAETTAGSMSRRSFQNLKVLAEPFG
jgi:hypothetical protein